MRISHVGPSSSGSHLCLTCIPVEEGIESHHRVVLMLDPLKPGEETLPLGTILREPLVFYASAPRGEGSLKAHWCHVAQRDAFGEIDESKPKRTMCYYYVRYQGASAIEEGVGSIANRGAKRDLVRLANVA
jgi:hypothetical protein